MTPLSFMYVRDIETWAARLNVMLRTCGDELTCHMHIAVATTRCQVHMTRCLKRATYGVSKLLDLHLLNIALDTTLCLQDKLNTYLVC